MSAWHHYKPGTIYWRLTTKGIEVKGQGSPPEFRNIPLRPKRFGTPFAMRFSPSPKTTCPHSWGLLPRFQQNQCGNPQAYRYEPVYTRYIQNKAAWKSNPYYDSPKRISASYGLMQIMYTTAYSVGFRGKPGRISMIQNRTLRLAAPILPAPIRCNSTAGILRKLHARIMPEAFARPLRMPGAVLSRRTFRSLLPHNEN